MNYDPKSSHAEEFIHHGEIEETLAYGEANRTNRELIDEILAKARERRGLTHREAMVLLDCGLEDKNQEIYELAEQIKRISTETASCCLRLCTCPITASTGVCTVPTTPRTGISQGRS